MGALGMACLNYNLKPKDMVGIPWLVALALRADGWWLRSDIIWHKPNPMPESVTDRPTKAHEYVFLLAKSERYYFDQEAVREPHTSGENTPEGLAARAAIGDPNGKRASTKSMNDGRDRTKPPSRPPGYIGHVNGRNIRTVWTIPTEPYAEAHFATFPTALAQRCIMAGSSERGCCTTCGAPWVSETQKGQAHDAGGGHRAHAEQRARQGVNGAMETGIWFDRVTLGWRASCQHLGEPVPCTVLDPFAGSGTVGQVAEDLGRDSVLVELNAEYVRLIRKRTGQAGLFASRAESAEKGSP
jgi:DNA modification methylase